MARRSGAAEGFVPVATYSISIRAQYPNKPGMLGRIATTIGEAGGDIGAVDIVRTDRSTIVRDISIAVRDDEHGRCIRDALVRLKGVTIRRVTDPVFLAHDGGKIEIHNKTTVSSRGDLSRVYTPGVARVCLAIKEKPEAAWSLTIKKNTVAVVTDGTAVLGLGDIGPLAALPVMEGKAMLFKEFGGVDAWPICLDTKDSDEIVATVKYIAPAFGGINLEDISAPRCFEIEERLKRELDIPVFHDDQHGTAVVVLGALLNAVKIVKKEIPNLRVVISGVGAAGVACTKIFLSVGITHIIGCDSRGIVYRGRKEGMNPVKEWFAEHTNPENRTGTLSDAMAGADLFLGVSRPNLLTPEDLKKMNKDSIVFALANPDPEIRPEEALPYVRVMATGRSDYANQINNVLCFPGLFRGVLDARAWDINEPMKVAAAHAIADSVGKSELSDEYIIPSVFNRAVFQRVARAAAEAAYESGAAERHRKVHPVYI
ncbi:MAG: malate dehydrogenase [Chloroflexi bacterium RBG_16_68_14]|nr:MAG: malate dehydrogenase [Chloroflexi bacterium RBG_16_68_14]